nr:glycoside hydrolase family 48 protein [Clostridium sp. Marseille-P299]
MRKHIRKKVTAAVAVVAILFSLLPKTPQLAVLAASEDAYQQRFLDLWGDLHDPNNGYFSDQGIPYHSIETLIVEAPDYGHVTTSEALSYYMWLEAMYGKFTGDFSGFEKAWDVTETYMIPTEEDQPNTSMSKYTASKPATYAPEWQDPSQYPAVLDFTAAVGVDPISNDLVSTYGTSTIYGMHWLLDVDNWYGFGSRGDGTSKPSYINTFQRGEQESTWETIPQPSWDAMNFGGVNGFLDIFTGDKTYAQQFKYTNAPDADARAVQATYWANLWAAEYGVNIDTYVDKATKMGDYLRYSMFDKYFRKIGNSTAAGTGYDSAHYLLSWYYAWGGGIESAWAWKIGSSHNHFGYQNPMAAWILAKEEEFKPASQNGQADWAKSLDRQLEFYQWLQSSEGAIAGGASNSNNGRYEAWPAGTSTFYGMGYVENPVYADPGSNTWFGFQAWSMQRVAELYYQTGDVRAKNIMDKWVGWIKTVVDLNADGTFAIPSNIDWSGQPDTWTGTYTGNPNLHVTVTSKGTDLGITASLANTLLYYSKASGDDSARVLAKELLDRMWNLYRDDKGLSAPEARADYKRFFEQEVYVPSTFNGTMPNGDALVAGVNFLDIRSKYLDDPDYQKVLDAYNAGTAPEFNYHRFWAQCDIAIANGLYSILFEEPSQPVENAAINPSKADFDKATDKQEDISVEMTLNGYSLNGILNGNTALVDGADYTVTGSTVVISKDYFALQPIGKVQLTFDFSGGIDKVLTVTVVDTSVVELGDIKVQMFNGNTASSTNGIAPRIKLYNNGDTIVKLSDVKLRYYYTIDGEIEQNFWCDWSTIGSSNVTGKFVKMDNAKTGADYYLEVGFANGAGNLEVGQSIEVQVRFSKSNWTNYTQTGDYSFNSTNNNYVDWAKITGYLGDKLEWGMEPQ